MESDAVDVGEVTDEDPDALPLLGRPQSNGLIVTTADEVIALSGELHRPDGVHVALKKF
jgi:hypothetical protein